MDKDDEAADLKKLAQERDLAYEVAHQKSHDLWEFAANSSLSPTEIARILGVTRGAVYSWRRQRRK